jgi:hypothetical protein
MMSLLRRINFGVNTKFLLENNRMQQAGRSIQAGAALAPGVSQQAFKHAAGIRVAGVISARAIPISKIPIGGASFGD